MYLTSLINLALTIAPAQPAIASATPNIARVVERSSLVMSADAPRDGEDAISLGVAFFGPMPAIDLRYVRGVGDRTALEGVLSSAGIVQRVRAGVRYRLTSDVSRYPIAIRASVMEMHDLGDTMRLAAGIGPGLVFTYRQGLVHWTASCDLAWSFLDRQGKIDGLSAVQVHPSVGVELPIGDEVHLAIEGSTLVTANEYDVFVLPLLSGGLAW